MKYFVIPYFSSTEETNIDGEQLDQGDQDYYDHGVEDLLNGNSNDSDVQDRSYDHEYDSEAFKISKPRGRGWFDVPRYNVGLYMFTQNVKLLKRLIIIMYIYIAPTN